MTTLDPTGPGPALDEMLRNGPVDMAVDAFLAEMRRPDQLDQQTAMREGMRRALKAAARAAHDRIDDQLCVCGHPRDAHYTYIRNGVETMRCKSCDPMAGAPEGNYAFESDSYIAAMNERADHDFVPQEDHP